MQSFKTFTVLPAVGRGNPTRTIWSKMTTRRTASIRMASTTSSSSTAVSRDDLLEEAEYLTKSLYRNCLRSVRLIRWGNEFDDKEFQRREEEFQNPTAGGVMSMAPPPNKEDELRSRAEYYHSYAREYFTQESDCLDNDPLQERDIRRYQYYLRKGEKDRKWLLGDMMFSDPYKNAFDKQRVNRFEEMFKKYLNEDEEEEDFAVEQEFTSTSSTSSGDGFIEDEDPDWFQKVREKQAFLALLDCRFTRPHCNK